MRKDGKNWFIALFMRVLSGGSAQVDGEGYTFFQFFLYSRMCYPAGTELFQSAVRAVLCDDKSLYDGGWSCFGCAWVMIVSVSYVGLVVLIVRQ